MKKIVPDGKTPVNPKQVSTINESANRSWSHQEFLAWEQASRDTIDVKRCYVDLAQGDLIAGILLSQIVYYHLPAKNGADNKLIIERDGEKWLAKGRADWWDECRITPKQYDRAADILEQLGVIETKTMRFGGSPTKHIRVCWEAFLRDLALISMRVQGGKMDIPQRGKTGLPDGEPVIPQRSKSKFPKGEYRSSPTGEIEIAEMGKSLTETTAQTTSKTTTKTLPPPPVHPAAGLPLGAQAERETEEEEESFGNASPVRKEEVKAEETERVEAMLSVLARVTRTSIEIEALRPLALECVRREHKDAWTHTLAVLTAKMAGDRKPTMPNRFAATVLKNALESPVPPPPARPSKAPAPLVAAPVETQEPLDAPALWAMKKARRELSGSGAAAFKQKHGRPSGQADWDARAKELEAKAAKKDEKEDEDDPDEFEDG